jgi:hypothetical protein
MAETLQYLQENGLLEFGQLEKRATGDAGLERLALTSSFMGLSVRENL